jgi:hypothetical protein
MLHHSSTYNTIHYIVLLRFHAPASKANTMCCLLLYCIFDTNTLVREGRRNNSTDIATLHPHYLQVPRGPLTVSLTLGPECQGGCTAQVILAVARKSGSSASAFPGVPISKVADPFAPFTTSASMQLPMAQVKPAGSVFLRIGYHLGRLVQMCLKTQGPAFED